MSWESVGNWIKDNAGKGAALIGSLVTGNVPGAVAAGVSLISSATGTDDPVQALEQLQNNPETLLKLKELYYREEESIRNHLQEMTRLKLEDQQKEHETTQQTIQTGDTASDIYVRHTRPKMARESWIATICYCIGCFGVQAITKEDYFNIYLAGVLSSPAWAYLGLRTTDKLGTSVKQALQKYKQTK